jgi:hypothetical protein
MGDPVPGRAARPARSATTGSASSRKWKSGDDTRAFSPEEREALRREWAEAKARRAEEQERSENEAAIEAAEIWARATHASHLHPYAQKKRLNAAVLKQSGDKLLIPMFDGAGKLWNLQRIAPDGTKRFLRGGRTEGLFTIIGEFTARGESAASAKAMPRWRPFIALRPILASPPSRQRTWRRWRGCGTTPGQTSNSSSAPTTTAISSATSASRLRKPRRKQ